MIIETVAVKKRLADSLEVVALTAQACGACASKPGCGQHLFAKLLGHESVLYVPIEQAHAERVSEGDLVDVGIREHALLALAGLGYFLPILVMILVIALLYFLRVSEVLIALAALLALLVSGVVASRVMKGSYANKQLQPIFIGKSEASSLNSQEQVLNLDEPD